MIERYMLNPWSLDWKKVAIVVRRYQKQHFSAIASSFMIQLYKHGVHKSIKLFQYVKIK